MLLTKWLSWSPFCHYTLIISLPKRKSHFFHHKKWVTGQLLPHEETRLNMVSFCQDRYWRVQLNWNVSLVVLVVKQTLTLPQRHLVRDTLSLRLVIWAQQGGIMWQCWFLRAMPCCAQLPKIDIHRDTYKLLCLYIRQSHPLSSSTAAANSRIRPALICFDLEDQIQLLNAST